MAVSGLDRLSDLDAVIEQESDRRSSEPEVRQVAEASPRGLLPG